MAVDAPFQGLNDLFDPLRDLINSLKAGISGAPQYDLGLVGDIGGTGIPNVGSNEDIQALIDQLSAGLPEAIFTDPAAGSEFEQLQIAVRQAGQDFLATGSDEDRIRFNNAVGQLRSGASNIRTQESIRSGFGQFSDEFLNNINALFADGSEFADNLARAEQLRDTPTYSEEDILGLIGRGVGDRSRSATREESNTVSDFASRGINNSGLAADLLSSARINLDRDLSNIAATIGTQANAQNKSDANQFQQRINELLGLKTNLLGSAEQFATGLDASNFSTPGIGISNPDFFNQLSSALAQVDFFNQQTADVNFDNTVDSFLSNILAFDQSRKSNQSQDSGSSGSFNFGAGIGPNGIPTGSVGFGF